VGAGELDELGPWEEEVEHDRILQEQAWNRGRDAALGAMIAKMNERGFFEMPDNPYCKEKT
jgi:hypothetical protein